jgi:O-antigen biosynthesis protein
LIDRAYKAYRFWRTHGTPAMRQLIVRKLRQKFGYPTAPITHAVVNTSKNTSPAHLISTRFEALTPLRTYVIPPPDRRRVSVVTDSIGGSSLFGGVGTALILAALLANRLGAQLRIITRTECAQPDNVAHVLSLYGIKLEHEVQFKFAAFYDHKYEVDFSPGDLFITTSWWTTAATLPSVPASSILYLLQEDERMFYPFGDDRLRCEQVLQNKDIRFIINTKLLFDHFALQGLDNIEANGSWFEPAFPTQVFHPQPRVESEKHKFFFYARPNNLRNLFYLGIEVIEQAIARQVLNLNKWEIFFVGTNIPPIVFHNGYSPVRCENFSWAEYAKLASTVDLGLSLMCTPHPSYPPLDLAASGAVVVTNEFGNKRHLRNYSENLICTSLDRDALVEGIREGVLLATDPVRREQNFQNSGLSTDWNRSLAATIKQIFEAC